jgi:hypothetical protein
MIMTAELIPLVIESNVMAITVMVITVTTGIGITIASAITIETTGGAKPATVRVRTYNIRSMKMSTRAKSEGGIRSAGMLENPSFR